MAAPIPVRFRRDLRLGDGVEWAQVYLESYLSDLALRSHI